jgi:peptidoglycan/xylan/chitin deacetylase (PgdA/CDA1 family)
LRAAEKPTVLNPKYGSDNPTLHLAYHEILSSSSTYRYAVCESQFEQHLAFISSYSGFGAKSATVTFDDGHFSNFENAFPLLKRYALPATFFVLAGHVGTPKYVSWSQAREMTAAGHRVQSHGWSHRLLIKCSSSELDEELLRSKQLIEDRLGYEVDSLSVPGGRYNGKVLGAAQRAGYQVVFHSNPWTPNGMWRDVGLVGRLMVTKKMRTAELLSTIRASKAQRLCFRLTYGAKERARALVGDHFYHWLWCKIAKPYDDGFDVNVS